MIRRLRDRHRRMIPLLALVAALALAIAWFGRPRATPGEILPALRPHAEQP